MFNQILELLSLNFGLLDSLVKIEVDLSHHNSTFINLPTPSLMHGTKEQLRQTLIQDEKFATTLRERLLREVQTNLSRLNPLLNTVDIPELPPFELGKLQEIQTHADIISRKLEKKAVLHDKNSPNNLPQSGRLIEYDNHLRIQPFAIPQVMVQIDNLLIICCDSKSPWNCDIWYSNHKPTFTLEWTGKKITAKYRQVWNQDPVTIKNMKNKYRIMTTQEAGDYSLNMIPFRQIEETTLPYLAYSISLQHLIVLDRKAAFKRAFLLRYERPEEIIGEAVIIIQ
ncbi:MAG: hypothetical protein HQL69_11265 [Magnetococcales bacterium]|nr:hypothetical protein [Magnetococcales bacterium]